MDWLKEMFEAHNQRIKSPIIGSIILAFIAWNWQPIFYVLFATESVPERLKHWDEEVLHWHDYWVPAVIGIIIAFLMPIVTLVGAYISALPTIELRRFTNKQTFFVERKKRQDEHYSALENIGYQQELADRKEELEKRRESFIASRLRQQSALNQVKDEDIRLEISRDAGDISGDQNTDLTTIDMPNTDINNFIPDIDEHFGATTSGAIKNHWVHELIGKAAKKIPDGGEGFYIALPGFVTKNLNEKTLPINTNLLSNVSQIESLIKEISNAKKNGQGAFAKRLELALSEHAAVLQKFYIGLNIPEDDEEIPK